MFKNKAIHSSLSPLAKGCALSVALSFLVSCASLVTDPVVEVLIESEPPNATVLHRGSPIGVTPLKVYVPSKTKNGNQRRIFRLEHVGYKNATVNLYSSRNPYSLGNVVFTSTTSGAPSFLTDSYTDYAHTFSDESIVVELKKLPTQEELERDELEKSARDEQGRAGREKRERERLDKLERLKREKEEALKKIQEERTERERLEQQRLAEEQARLEAERRARDEEALKRAEAKAKAEAEAQERARLEAEAKAKAEAEAKAKAEAEAEAKAKAEAEAEAKAKAEAEAKAKAQEERGALKSGFEKLAQESSKLAAEREAFEQEKARLQAERERLEAERQLLDEQRRRSPDPEVGARSADPPSAAPTAKPTKKSKGSRSETIDEKEERLLKKLREHQKRMIERSRSKERLMRSPKSLPAFEIAPVEESSLLSPSWGALSLSVYHFRGLTRELAALSASGVHDSPTLKALFLRLSLAGRAVDERSWERYLLFRHLVVSQRAELLSQPHGLALYRRLKSLAHTTQICHSPSLFAGEGAH